MRIKMHFTLAKHGSADELGRFPVDGTQPALMAACGLLLIWGCAATLPADENPEPAVIPSIWTVMPVPRYVNYEFPDPFLTLGRVAVVRGAAGPYQTIRGADGELRGESTVIEEELVAELKAAGVREITCLDDRGKADDGYDTLILLGSPTHNALTAPMMEAMGLNFDRWDDPNTQQDDFTCWADFGREGYLLKVGRAGLRNVVILAGYDRDEAKGRFSGAGTYYAFQSFRQLIVRGTSGHGPRVKTAEIADKPLVAERGCYTGFDTREEKQWRDLEWIARMKSNQNIWWYGNGLVGYNTEATTRFRYPWKPRQLDLFRRVGRWCREHYITYVFCMNPDHYRVDWAAARTFDGSKKDPLHYDPDYPVEPEFQEMWAKLGYDVKSDTDIMIAKFGQVAKVVPGAMLQMMNEDDQFGLVHESDKKRFGGDTGDPKQDAISYGRARGLFLGALYKGIHEKYPDSNEFMPIIPPGQLGYQLVLDRNEANSRPFLSSLGATLKELGLQKKMPIITTGGGTAAEVVTNRTIDHFITWSGGSPVELHDNNFSSFHVGAYETDPKGPRTPGQVNGKYPAGYRDRDLYKRLWAIAWNGIPDEPMLTWSMGQFMWNMLALDREKTTSLAARKTAGKAELYPLLRSLYDAYDNPACYLTDNPPPYHLRYVSDTIYFPGKDNHGWTYDIRYTDANRREAQRLYAKLTRLVPQLEAAWPESVAKRATLDQYGYNRLCFLSVYLTYGYLKGWEQISDKDLWSGNRLRDLYLRALDVQERYFHGPEKAECLSPVDRSFYRSNVHYIYSGGVLEPAEPSPAKAATYVDIWKEGLAGKYFEPVARIDPAKLAADAGGPDGDWGEVRTIDGEALRQVTVHASLAVPKAEGRLLIRVRIGGAAANPSDQAQVTLAVGGAMHKDVVVQPRWIAWLLPSEIAPERLVITAGKPLLVGAVEVYKVKTN